MPHLPYKTVMTLKNHASLIFLCVYPGLQLISVAHKCSRKINVIKIK